MRSRYGPWPRSRASPATSRGREVFHTLVAMVTAVTVRTAIDPVQGGQAVWNAVHGAVTIELAGVSQIAYAATSFDDTLDLLVGGLHVTLK
jgi:hypothetical protein